MLKEGFGFVTMFLAVSIAGAAIFLIPTDKKEELTESPRKTDFEYICAKLYSHKWVEAEALRSQVSRPGIFVQAVQHAIVMESGRGNCESAKEIGERYLPTVASGELDPISWRLCFELRQAETAENDEAEE